jgi:hypothetical protein
MAMCVFWKDWGALFLSSLFILIFQFALVVNSEFRINSLKMVMVLAYPNAASISFCLVPNTFSI